MNFEEAIEKMDLGLRMRRPNWHPSTHCFLWGSSIVSNEETADQEHPSDLDMKAEDWEIFLNES